MISLRAIPMVRLVLPFALGVIFSTWFPAMQLSYLIALVVGLGVLMWLVGKRKVAAHQQTLVFGSLTLLVLFLFGVLKMKQSDLLLRSNHFSKIETEKPQLVGMISSLPKKGKWWKTEIKIVAKKNAEKQWVETDGKVLAFVDSLTAAGELLDYGTMVYLRKNPSAVDPPKNPHQFDYKSYLKNKNIEHQLFLKAGDVVALSQGHGNPVWTQVYLWRKNLLKVLEKHLKSKHTFAVGAALLLGHKNDLSVEVQQTFVATGTMHILAVSGAHVGILFGCLSYILGLFPFYWSWWRIFKQVLLVAIVWLFVLITGAAEPAVRAAAILSLVSLAQIMHRDRNIYNLLGLTAFLMLLYEPRQIFGLGFQFSFGAVLGIALFWGKFRRLVPWQWPNWSKKVMDLVLLGCAAQLGILPLSIYYFHQLPVFFWLTGTLVVPFVTVYLWGGILLLFSSTMAFLAPLSALIGKSLDFLLSMMVKVLEFFQSLPGHLIEGIYLSGWMTILLLGSIYAAAWAMYVRKKKALYLCASSLLLVSIGHVSHWYQARAQEALIVYSTQKGLLIDGIVGHQVFSINKAVPEGKADFYQKNNRVERGVRSQILEAGLHSDIFSSQLVFAVGEKRIAIIEEEWTPKNKDKIPEKIKIDALFLRGKKEIKLSSQLLLFEPEVIVIDGSSSKYQKKKWGEAAKKAGLPMINIHEKALEI